MAEIFNLDNLVPELPEFSWGDKTYKGTADIYFPSTRVKYAKLLAKFEETLNKEEINALEKEWFDFIADLFPGIKEDNLLAELPDDVRDGLTQWITCKILGVPYIHPGHKYSHDDAEKAVEILIKKRMKSEGMPREVVERELDNDLKKK